MVACGRGFGVLVACGRFGGVEHLFSLRCEICKEFYTNPMQIDCDHCFCSKCIRREFAGKNEKAECPKCRARVGCESLVPNRALAQLVDIFKTSRAALLQKVRQTQPNAAVPGMAPSALRCLV